MEWKAFIIGLALLGSAVSFACSGVDVAAESSPLPYENFAEHILPPSRLARLKKVRHLMGQDVAKWARETTDPFQFTMWVGEVLSCSIPEASELIHQAKLDAGKLSSPFDSDWPRIGFGANELFAAEGKSQVMWLRVDNSRWLRASGNVREKAQQIIHTRSLDDWWPEVKSAEVDERFLTDGTLLLKVVISK